MLLYGSETSATYRHLEKRLNAFHFCCLRSIIGAYWRDRIPNINWRELVFQIYSLSLEHINSVGVAICAEWNMVGFLRTVSIDSYFLPLGLSVAPNSAVKMHTKGDLTGLNTENWNHWQWSAFPGALSKRTSQYNTSKRTRSKRTSQAAIAAKPIVRQDGKTTEIDHVDGCLLFLKYHHAGAIIRRTRRLPRALSQRGRQKEPKNTIVFRKWPTYTK